MARKPKVTKIANTFGKGTVSNNEIKQIQKKLITLTKKYGDMIVYFTTNKFFLEKKLELNTKREIARLEKELADKKRKR